MDVTVNTGEVQLRTCRLTKSIIKQMPKLTYKDLVDTRILLGSERTSEEENSTLSQYVVGWVNDAAVGGSETGTWLIIKTGEGQYGKFDAHFEHRKRFPQIYVI